MPIGESELLQDMERGGWTRLITGLAVKVREFFVRELEPNNTVTGDPPLFPIDIEPVSPPPIEVIKE